MNSPSVNRESVLLSLQRALVGEVFPALRAVTVEWSESAVKFIAYVDGELEEADSDSLSSVAAEVSADFPPSVEVDYEIVRRDGSAAIQDGRLRVFRRREQ